MKQLYAMASPLNRHSRGTRRFMCSRREEEAAWVTRWRPVPPVAPRTVTRIQFTSAKAWTIAA